MGEVIDQMPGSPRAGFDRDRRIEWASRLSERLFSWWGAFLLTLGPLILFIPAFPSPIIVPGVTNAETAEAAARLGAQVLAGLLALSIAAIVFAFQTSAKEFSGTVTEFVAESGLHLLFYIQLASLTVNTVAAMGEGVSPWEATCAVISLILALISLGPLLVRAVTVVDPRWLERTLIKRATRRARILAHQRAFDTVGQRILEEKCASLGLAFFPVYPIPVAQPAEIIPADRGGSVKDVDLGVLESLSSQSSDGALHVKLDQELKQGDAILSVRSPTSNEVRDLAKRLVTIGRR